MTHHYKQILEGIVRAVPWSIPSTTNVDAGIVERELTAESG